MLVVKENKNRSVVKVHDEWLDCYQFQTMSTYFEAFRSEGYFDTHKMQMQMVPYTTKVKKIKKYVRTDVPHAQNAVADGSVDYKCEKN